MQNMIRCNDNMGFHFNIFFDIVDGDIQNIVARDINGDHVDMIGDMEQVKTTLAKEYAATAIEMALIYKSGMVPLKC